MCGGRATELYSENQEADVGSHQNTWDHDETGKYHRGDRSQPAKYDVQPVPQTHLYGAARQKTKHLPQAAAAPRLNLCTTQENGGKQRKQTHGNKPCNHDTHLRKRDWSDCQKLTATREQARARLSLPALL